MHTYIPMHKPMHPYIHTLTYIHTHTHTTHTCTLQEAGMQDEEDEPALSQRAQAPQVCFYTASVGHTLYT